MSQRYQNDYSRFDGIGGSSDEEDGGIADGINASRDAENAAALNAAFGNLRASPPVGTGLSLADYKPLKRVPKYVTIDPNHPHEVIPDTVFGHPDDFVPKIDPGRGYIHDWGIMDDPTVEEADEANELLMYRRQFGNLYAISGADTPEVQFCKALAKRKLKKLEQQLPDVSKFFGCDFIVKIRLMASRFEDEELVRPVWRRIKVSGGISLSAFQDKIISPAMGWARNAHYYVFTDRTDGSVFGPGESSASDMMHLPNETLYAEEDTNIKLAQLLNKPGEKINYLYDLGDGWPHIIELEEIIDAESSTGAAELLDGFGGCPAEDSRGQGGGLGPHHFNKLLKVAMDAEEKKSVEARKKIAIARQDVAQATNYVDPPDRIAVKTWPLAFDLEAARKRMKVALASKASNRMGTKMIHHMIHGTPDQALLLNEPGGKGTKTIRTPLAGTHNSFKSETLSTKRDKSKVALCAECGSPRSLKACSGCRKIYYCSPACQKMDWKSHKNVCGK